MKRYLGKKGGFWNKEYRKSLPANGQRTHLALSSTPSEDLQKFIRWFLREYKTPLLRGEQGRTITSHSSVLDLGCGNGRNLIYLAKEFGVKGIGIDTSHEAIAQAKNASPYLPLSYIVQSIGLPLPVPDQSQDLVLDMMT